MDIYYEVRGTGPVLLMIPGGNGDAGPYERVAEALAPRRTVVIYDRRGFSRSAPAVKLRLATDVDDAVRLIDKLSDGPADVFGNSSGAIVGLELLARHPDRVRTLVAHEPPSVTLLPDTARHLAFFDEVYDTYRRDGVEAAMATFAAGTGSGGAPQPPPGVELPPPIAEMIARIQRNLPFWLEHELRQYTAVTPDVAALAAVSSQLVLAGGRDSRDQLPYRPNLVLAERLGLSVVDFPGDHIGFVRHPVEFAEQLDRVL